MRRLVRFVGPTRPKPEQAQPAALSSEPTPLARDADADRPLDVGAASGSAEPASDAGMVDAVARESLGD
jgi:hypothetical protein